MLFVAVVGVGSHWWQYQLVVVNVETNTDGLYNSSEADDDDGDGNGVLSNPYELCQGVIGGCKRHRMGSGRRVGVGTFVYKWLSGDSRVIPANPRKTC